MGLFQCPPLLHMDPPLTDEEFLEEFFKHPSINIQGENSRFSPTEWAKMERIRDVALAVHFDKPLRLFNILEGGEASTISLSDALKDYPDWREYSPTVVITQLLTTYAWCIFPEWVHYADDIASEKFYGDDPESYRIAS